MEALQYGDITTSGVIMIPFLLIALMLRDVTLLMVGIKDFK